MLKIIHREASSLQTTAKNVQLSFIWPWLLEKRILVSCSLIY